MWYHLILHYYTCILFRNYHNFNILHTIKFWVGIVLIHISQLTCMPLINPSFRPMRLKTVCQKRTHRHLNWKSWKRQKNGKLARHCSWRKFELLKSFDPALYNTATSCIIKKNFLGSCSQECPNETIF